MSRATSPQERERGGGGGGRRRRKEREREERDWEGEADRQAGGQVGRQIDRAYYVSRATSPQERERGGGGRRERGRRETGRGKQTDRQAGR